MNDNQPTPVPDLSQPCRIHIVGAGGAGMGAIASVLAAMGHHVSGSDLKESATATRLSVEGVEVRIGHDASYVQGADLVAISTAIPGHNPEVRAALASGIPVARRSDLLPLIGATRRTIAVAGTHGKTTTSSMLALVLVEAGLDPSFIIGGDVNEIGSGAVWADGEWFVIEADESDRTFLSLGAEVALVTNVEPDHLETYGNDEAELHKAFETFASEAHLAVICLDDEGSAVLAPMAHSRTYGTREGADYHMVDIDKQRATTSFTLMVDGNELGRITLPMAGLHNALNALGAATVALEIGADFDAVARALGRFGGVARRFEFRGTADGVTFVDDYAHLPTEVSAAVTAGRDGSWDRLIAVFQPHRYSRTEAVGSQFGESFDGADIVVLTDVFSAGETPRPGVSGLNVVHAVQEARPDLEVVWAPRLDDVADWLTENLQTGDLCLTLGAGDLTTMADIVRPRLDGRQ